MIKSNFHTHTVFCDGADTPEELVNEAVKKGFFALGFSGHSYFEPDSDVCMAEMAASRYRQCVNLLKDRYKDKIKILCGVEQDYYSVSHIGVYDYVIGSVHSVLKNGVYLSVDASADTFSRNLNECYSGDFDAFAEDYFALVGNVVNKTNADIIGHFDLILKYSGHVGYTPTPRFLTAAERTVDKLIPFSRPFEINTGAMARGARDVPYPIPEILKMIKDRGGKIVFSSDCHEKSRLDFGFDIAEAIAKEIGFTEHGIITEKGVEYIPISI